MPVSKDDISQAIQTAASFSPGGNTWGMVCGAIGEAVASWIVVPANVRLMGITTGTVGAGLVQGSLNFPANPTLIVGALTSGGFGGQTTDRFASAVANGIASSLTRSARYLGTSVGVATGTDISRVVLANSATLGTLLNTILTSKCASRQGTGPYTPSFMIALASGISSMILLGGTQPGTGIVTPSGPTSAISGTGTSPSSSVL